MNARPSSRRVRAAFGLPGWRALPVVLRDEVRPVWGAAWERARSHGWQPHDDPAVAAGQLVELLAAAYLAGP